MPTIPDRGALAATTFSPTPDDIDTLAFFWSAFDHRETEVSARWIVRFMQERGLGWAPFTREEIEAFYHLTQPASSPFNFNRLVEPGSAYCIMRGRVMEGGGWIVLGKDGRYYPTEDFVLRCHKSSPRTR